MVPKVLDEQCDPTRFGKKKTQPLNSFGAQNPEKYRQDALTTRACSVDRCRQNPGFKHCSVGNLREGAQISKPAAGFANPWKSPEILEPSGPPGFQI